MRLAACLILVPLVVGCNVHSKNPANGDHDVTIKADQNEVSFNIPIGSGKVKLPEGAMKNSNFDIDGVKLMPGSSVTGFNVDAHDKGATVQLSFAVPATPDQVRAYFLDQFKAKGVEASATRDGVKGKSKDGSDFAIRLQPASGGSAGKIELQSKN